MPPSAYLASQFIDVLIDGNTISQGQNTSNDLYSNGIHLEHNGIIVNNSISGATGAYLELYSPTITATNNRMYRGTNSIAAFVDGGADFIPFAAHTIQDNYFDNTTRDGGNTALIINISSVTVATQNTNQTEYAVVALSESVWADGLITSNSNPGNSYAGAFVYSSGQIPPVKHR